MTDHAGREPSKDVGSLRRRSKQTGICAHGRQESTCDTCHALWLVSYFKHRCRQRGVERDRYAGQASRLRDDKQVLLESLKYLLGQCENFDGASGIPEVRSAMRCAKAAIANAGGWPITIDGEVPNE